MATYVVEKSFASNVAFSPNVAAVAQMFGLGTDQSRIVKVIDRCEIRIEPGQVVYITGGSGAGKTLLLKLLREQLSDVIDPDTLPMPQGRAVVDCFQSDLHNALNWLSRAGLSDAFAILRRPEELSDGQRYRFRLALALSRKPSVICIDEFCTALDRVTAAVVAYNVRKFADRFGTTFIVATSHDDLLEDLCPDVMAIKHLGGVCDVYYPRQLQVG